jgi:quinol monooxygenase YgiN
MFRSPRFRILLFLLLSSGASVHGAVAGEASGVRYDQLPEGAYAVVAEIRAKPGKEALLRAATLPLVEKVRAERNNLVYFLQEDRESPGHFVFYEIFASLADFEAHNATPHVQAWFAQLPELADGGVKVTRLQILGNRTAQKR